MYGINIPYMADGMGWWSYSFCMFLLFVKGGACNLKCRILVVLFGGNVFLKCFEFLIGGLLGKFYEQVLVGRMMPSRALIFLNSPSVMIDSPLSAERWCLLPKNQCCQSCTKKLKLVSCVTGKMQKKRKRILFEICNTWCRVRVWLKDSWKMKK